MYVDNSARTVTFKRRIESAICAYEEKAFKYHKCSMFGLRPRYTLTPIYSHSHINNMQSEYARTTRKKCVRSH